MKGILLLVGLLLSGIVHADTNTPVRVQCFSQTQSGTRCKRRAVPGERYCRQHSPVAPVKAAVERCWSLLPDGSRCPERPPAGKRYCDKHAK